MTYSLATPSSPTRNIPPRISARVKAQTRIQYGKKLMLAGVVTGLTLVSLALLQPANAQDVSRRTITVSGHGVISARPDTVDITLGVQSQAKSASDALTANTQSMQKLFSELKAGGVEEKNIQTSQFSVNPVYSRSKNNEPAVITGYRVTNTVNVTITEIDKLGNLLDVVVKAGGNRINGIRFSIADASALLDKAREEAVKNAVHKAKLYVGAAGVALGQVLSIQESGSHAPQPMFLRQAKMEMDSSVPIAAGEQNISANVTLVIELE